MSKNYAIQTVTSHRKIDSKASKKLGKKEQIVVNATPATLFYPFSYSRAFRTLVHLI